MRWAVSLALILKNADRLELLCMLENLPKEKQVSLLRGASPKHLFTAFPCEYATNKTCPNFETEAHLSLLQP